MMVRSLYTLVLLAAVATCTVRAADPSPSGRATNKVSEKTPPPAARLPDLAVTKFAMNTDKVNHHKTNLLIRIENIGTAPSARTGVIVDCRLPDRENRQCRGASPPPRFPLPALAAGAGHNLSVPLRRFLPAAGKQTRHELYVRVDTGARIPDSNRFNNVKKLEIVY